MATKTISKVAVSADGWSLYVTIASLNIGGTHVYDFGSLDDTPATTTAPTFTITVVSEGYNAAGTLGTISRTLYGTHVVRKAHPNQASRDEDDSTADMVVRVSMSECIYNDDRNNGAGTSGTDPVVNIAAGWFSNGTDTTAALTNYSIATADNASTLDYPKVIAQWAWGHTPAWRRVAAAFTIGCIAYHGHGIACVALSATEGVNVVSGIATSKTAHLMSASALYYESYDLAVPVTTLTQGNDITLKFVAYPLVGDADSIIDTSTNTTSTDDILGLTQITCTCDKTGALIDYAVVSTAGNDTTGAKSTTLSAAAASPYLTVGKALASGATVIYLRAGTLDWLGSTPVSVTQRNYAIEIAPYPGETVELQRQSTWKDYKAKIIEYRDFSGASEIKCVSATGYLNGGAVAGAKVFFRNNRFTATTPCGNPGTGYRSEGCWWINNTHAADEDFRGTGGGLRNCYSLTGNSFTATLVATGNKAVYSLVANKTVHSLWAEKTAAQGGPTPQNIIFANNSITSVVINAGRVFQWADTSSNGSAVNGLAVVGNVVEVKTITSSTAAFYLGADGSLLDVSNALVAHNTVIGERCNMFYNDSGVAANVRNNCFLRNNAFMSYNIKSDVFATANAARVGNWAMMNGVNFSDNRYDGTAGFPCDWHGINVAYVTGQNTTYGQLGYTDDNSAGSGDGTGNGDYMPTEASVLYDHDLVMAYQSYDLYGTAL